MTKADRAAALADEIEASTVIVEPLTPLSRKVVSHVDHTLIVRALRRLAEQAAPSPAPANLREVVAGAIGSTQMKILSNGRWMSHSSREYAERDADAALSAITTAGYMIVPREPTEEMVAITWRAACGARPVGAGDGDTYVVRPPTREDMRAALRAALSTKEAGR